MQILLKKVTYTFFLFQIFNMIFKKGKTLVSQNMYIHISKCHMTYIWIELRYLYRVTTHLEIKEFRVMSEGE